MKVFYSKKGLWLSLILWVPFPCTIIAAIKEKELSAIIGLSAVLLFVAWLWFDTRYIIKDNTLVIKCGPFKYPEIPIDKIKKITHSRSALSAPACSLDRILVSYAKYDDILISPKNEDIFIKILQDKNPNIQYIPKQT